jgi:hypothetical protein
MGWVLLNALNSSALLGVHGVSSCNGMGLVSSCVAAFRLLSLCWQLARRPDCLPGDLGVVVCAGFDRASRKCFHSVCTPPLVVVVWCTSSCAYAAVLLWLVQALACWRARLLSAQRGSLSQYLIGAARIVGGVYIYIYI